MSSPLNLLVVLFLAGLRVDVPPSDKLPKTGGISLSKAKSAVRGYEGIHSWYQPLCQLLKSLNDSRMAIQRAAKKARETMPSSSARVDEHSGHIGVDSSHSAGCISLPPGEASRELKASYDKVMNDIRALVLQPIKPIKELAAGRILQRTQATKIPYLNHPVLWSTRLVLKVVNIDMSAKEELGYQGICGKGQDPQLPNGFQTIAREALVDLHFAIRKVGDFQGKLSSKVAYLVKAMIERIEEFKRVHGDNVEMQPKVVIYVHWEQMASTIACHLARNGISTSILTGQQSETERETVITQIPAGQESHVAGSLWSKGDSTLPRRPRPQRTPNHLPITPSYLFGNPGPPHSTLISSCCPTTNAPTLHGITFDQPEHAITFDQPELHALMSHVNMPRASSRIFRQERMEWTSEA